MQRDEATWQRAETEAKNFLRRYQDPWTRSHREDLVQEVSLAAWRWAGAIRHPERFWAAVQTIARRTRARARRAPRLQALPNGISLVAPESTVRSERRYVIAGRDVPESVARPWLRSALDRLLPVDRELLLGFYEGFCCSELAERFRRSLPCVKTRIHRARLRVQRTVEACARTAHDLDD